MSNIFLFILGTAIGSFLNVLIDRLPREESINGRSHCEYCKKTLSPLDLVPVLSFLFLKGKCRYCGKKLSLQYPGIEILTGVLFILIYNLKFEIFNSNFKFLISNYAIVSCLIVIFFIDLKNQIIPDEMQIALFITVLLSKIVVGVTVTALGYALVAGLIVLLPILFLYLITRGRGMGFGDVKLAFNMGFFLGIKGGFVAIYLGFILGAIFGIVLLLMKKKKMKSKIAFGPFLVAGMVIVLFFEKPIFSLIQRIYGI
ncbi:prepilin peptidase [Candidatus Roizmanbacteria bacterium]|nr:prepilin peptidase [Candidatus Roizmanbacteria bacterium]